MGAQDGESSERASDDVRLQNPAINGGVGVEVDGGGDRNCLSDGCIVLFDVEGQSESHGDSDVAWGDLEDWGGVHNDVKDELIVIIWEVLADVWNELLEPADGELEACFLRDDVLCNVATHNTALPESVHKSVDGVFGNDGLDCLV